MKLEKKRPEYTVAEMVCILKARGCRIDSKTILDLIDRCLVPNHFRSIYGRRARQYRVFCRLSVLQSVYKWCRERRGRSTVQWRGKLILKLQKRMCRQGILDHTGMTRIEYDYALSRVKRAKIA